MIFLIFPTGADGRLRKIMAESAEFYFNDRFLFNSSFEGTHFI